MLLCSAVASAQVPEFQAADDSLALPQWESPVPQLATREGDRVVTIPAQYNRPVQIGLLTGVSKVQLQGSPARIVVDGMQIAALAHGLEARFSAGLVQLRSSGRLVASSPRIELRSTGPGQALLVNGKPYRGSVEVRAMDGNLVVVNSVAVEDYLRGVVPLEVGRLDSSGAQALRAQAVAARTYAYRHFDSRKSQGFDIYADTRDQVYGGASAENPAADSAVEDTRGIVITWKGTPIDAYFHSTCGGWTESTATWQKPDVPYLRAAPDVDANGNPWCSASPHSSWEWTWSRKELDAIARKYVSTARPDTVFPFHHIESIAIQDHLTGGRVSTVTIHTDAGHFHVQGDHIRWLFRNAASPDKILPSAWIALKLDAKELRIRGRGMGHGIGMCQMGARGMSSAGIGWRDILLHYYPGTALVAWRSSR